MSGFAKFNPVNFSKNITKTISAVESKIGKVAAAPKSLTDKLNAETGLNIAAPPLPPINANVKSLVGSVKTLVKNPNGVVKGGITAISGAANSKLQDVAINSLNSAINGAATGTGVKGKLSGFVSGSATPIKGAILTTLDSAKASVSGFVTGGTNNFGGIIQGGITNATGAVTGYAKASFGVASVAVRNSLFQIKGNLKSGIKNCLRNAVSPLLANINVPNIPFGGINVNVSNLPNITGAVSVSKKLNKYLNAQITLLGNLRQKKLTVLTTINSRLDTLKDVKNSNFYTAKLTSEVNKNVNKICNTLSPRNKKMLSKGGAMMDMVSNVASTSIINNIENQVIKSASGFSAKSPKDFFNSVTGIPKNVVNKATGKIAIAAEEVKSVATSTVTSTKSVTAETYNKLKDAINSNVPKLD